MINYGRVKSSTRPEPMEITATSVFIASNITEYTEDLDGITVNGYEYDYVGYDKDEYLTTVALDNVRAINELMDELQAAKIILGVD